MNFKIIWELSGDRDGIHVPIREGMIKVLMVAVVTLLALPFLAHGADGLSRDEVVSVVLRDNPRLKAARAKWQAMTKRIPQAKAWEDPMVGVDVERKGTTQFTTYSDNEWMASQEIPITGKNLVRGRIADAEALGVFEELRRAELDAVSKARAAYVRVAGTYGQLEINSRNEELSKQFSEIARVKYEAGTQTQSEVLIAQTDLARVGEKRAQIERELSDQQTQLNVLMDRPPSSSLGRPARLAFAPLAISRNQIEAIALANRPEVIFAQHRIAAEKARRDLAKRQWIPDPRLRVEARQLNGSSGINEYDTGVFFSVPWPNYRKYSAGVSEAGKNLEMAESELQAARSEVLGMVRDQLKKIDTSAENYRRFADKIVPLATQAVQSTRSSYESDKTSFLELVTARRTSEEVESALLQYLIDHEVAVAELDAVIGKTNTSVRSGK